MKGFEKMEKTKLQIDMSVELNEVGFHEIRITSSKVDNSFQLRVGYWENIPSDVRKKLQDKFNVIITEEWEDEGDCGMLYNYEVEINDVEKLVDYIPTDKELEEMEFLHHYESSGVFQETDDYINLLETFDFDCGGETHKCDDGDDCVLCDYERDKHCDEDYLDWVYNNKIDVG